MWSLIRSPSRSAAGAILYVTIGTLMIIWAGLWYYYFLFPLSNPPAWQQFACVGTILSGVAIVTIGLLFGSIGRDAKAADSTAGAVTSDPVVTSDAVVTATPSTVRPVAVTGLPTASLGRSGTVERFSDGTVSMPR